MKGWGFMGRTEPAVFTNMCMITQEGRVLVQDRKNLDWPGVTFPGTIASSEEGEIFWVERKDLLSLPLAEDMADMLRVFEEDELSEFYYYKEDGCWKHRLL